MQNSSPKLAQSSDWCYCETQFDVEAARCRESLFTIGNGYIGVRGYFDEGYPREVEHATAATFLNGVYESLEIHYDEGAYGLATHCDRMVDVPRLEVKIELDGVVVDFSHGEVSGYQRTLDFKTGIYARKFNWCSPSGKQLSVHQRRVALLDNKHILMAQLELEALNFDGEVSVLVTLNSNSMVGGSQDDPRDGGGVPSDHWRCLHVSQPELCSQFVHTTRNSEIKVASTLLSVCSSEYRRERYQENHESIIGTQHSLELVSGKAQTVDAFVSYVDSRKLATDLRVKCEGLTLCKQSNQAGFDTLLEGQIATLANFWCHADIKIESDDGAQDAARFALMHLLQSTGNDGLSSIAAKGVTGAGYDGHYFWDAEIYVFPFWLFSDPERAKSLLRYRVNTLDQARKRAKMLGHNSGALYAWRTIGGDESSSYFPAGTAQFHINADIAYAARSYIRITDDTAFLFEGLAEMVLETARFWLSLGHFSDQRGGKFCICEVTGPDEYTAMVDNNYYTNSLARAHLRWAVEVVEILSDENASECKQLLAKLGLEASELSQMSSAADNMYLPFDQTLGIIEQCDGFLAKPKWSFDDTPKANYPLLLNYHPLFIYRHQILKQADTVLAMLMQGEDIDTQVKSRTYDYYEAITTHDSTLSPCVHGVMAAEFGDRNKAYDYMKETLTLDLDNHHANTHYGIHTAAMGGVWMASVQGFAGLRYASGELSFNPTLPEPWRSLEFKLQYRSRILRVRIEHKKILYQLLSDHGEICFLHKQSPVILSPKFAIKEFSL